MLKTVSVNLAHRLRHASSFGQLLPIRNYGTNRTINPPFQSCAIRHNIFLFSATSPNKRFYKQTGVLHAGDGTYEITLDNRKLKTPSGTPLVLKSEALAVAVAAEWNAQKEKIERASMHLVSS